VSRVKGNCLLDAAELERLMICPLFRMDLLSAFILHPKWVIHDAEWFASSSPGRT
jgi:hypothetical protein